MACPCCAAPVCADQCDGNGVPSQLAIQFTSVSFGLNSEFDEEDLPFDIPSTFLLPLRDANSACRLWSDSFYPRSAFCRPCGEGGFGVLSGLGITASRPALDPSQLNVTIIMAFGSANMSGNCLGVSSRLQLFSAGNICFLPITGTASNAVALCGSTNISAVGFTLEAA